MPLTRGTNDLGSPSICVRYTPHRPFNLIVKGGPATSRIELIFRTIQRGITTFAMIGTFLLMVLIFSGIRLFVSVKYDNPGLLWC